MQYDIQIVSQQWKMFLPLVLIFCNGIYIFNILYEIDNPRCCGILNSGIIMFSLL